MDSGVSLWMGMRVGTNKKELMKSRSSWRTLQVPYKLRLEKYAKRRDIRGVFITPGATAVTRIPNLLSSDASERTKPLMPCFAALYIGACMGVTWPAILETWMTALGEATAALRREARK